MNKVELLSPAGNFDKLRFAFAYGADAAYVGVKNFSLREGADNLTIQELLNATQYAHKAGKKLFVTSNIYFHEEDIKKFKDFIKEISNIGIDGLIVSDIGIVSFLREKYPEIPIHISTQANTLNSLAVKFYEKLGVKRVVLARELTLDEIKSIRDKTTLELETFVHGAFCVAYSGRCLLSNYFTNPSIYRPKDKPKSIKIEKTRDANKGDCAQVCRWSFYLVETNRMNDFLPIEIEENNATTILSSKDLNLAPFMKELIDAGINSFKIEGRMKSIYYVANTTRVYRRIIDDVLLNKSTPQETLEELEKISHREYFTGFYFEQNRLANTTLKSYLKSAVFLGYVINELEDGYIVKAANQIKQSDRIEVIFPEKNEFLINFSFYDKETLEKKEVIQPDEDFILKCDNKLKEFAILRRED
ncbi:MAG: U32 family peptidase [Brevinematales bacterium]|nr:U32 family peptidase [Brevinematales bacterium]